MLLIAFGHQSRVGKDTACNALTDVLNDTSVPASAVTFSFAKPLYNLAETVQKFYGQNVEKDRALLQALGGWGRTEDPLIWVNIMREKIKRALFDEQSVFISDVRYENEFYMLKSLGFTMVKILRKDRPIDGDPNHPSEIALANANWDMTIANDGTELEFIDKVKKTFIK